MAYRSPRERSSVAPAQTGLVVDMVRQFADRYAFVRELVQNAVDAGATSIDVRAELGPNDTATSCVQDDGEGMSREEIEGPLLTLFNSSKDTDVTKIGKYGVGFVSVFAIEPERVVVETWQPGASWVVTLLPDHSYELATGAERAGSGTAVTVICQLTGEQFSEHVQQVGAALRRWCRHAGLPIRYRVPALGGAGAAELSVDERIDRPLGVRTSIMLRDARADEQIVLGPSAGALLSPAEGHEPPADGRAGDDDSPAGEPSARPAEPEDSPSFAGFYNRGLTLFETTEPPLPGLENIRFKVLSPHLEHTLSRDNVRHNDAYERLLRYVEELVHGPLRRMLSEELAVAAHAVTTGQGPARYAALLAAASRRPLRLDADEVAVPLAVAVDERAVLSLAELRELGDGVVYAAAARGPLTAALAQQHRPVLLAAHPAIPALVAQRFETGSVRHVDQAFLLADELPTDQLNASDRQLCEAALAALQQAGVRVERVGIAHTQGIDPPRGAIAAPADRPACGLLLSEHEASTWWRRWGEPPALLLADRHVISQRARRRAEHHTGVAAMLLARALLVEERGALGKRTNDRLLDASRQALRPRRRRGSR